ncbi:MAG: hypothetical protein ACRC0X_03675 [Brevinema sp.]
MLFYLLLFLPIFLYTQDTESVILSAPVELLYTDTVSETNVDISTKRRTRRKNRRTNETTTQSNTNHIYSPPYKTFNYQRFKTKNIPQLATSKGMLQNLDDSYWALKFYSHTDIALYESMALHIKDNQINIKAFGYAQELLEESAFLLSPVKMFKPNEGIFAYSDPQGQIYFVYLHLLLQHLLALKMVTSYEQAELASQQSLTELALFILQ